MEVCLWVKTVNILELLQHIVNEPALRLASEGGFLRAVEELVVVCLLKDPEVKKHCWSMAFLDCGVFGQ